MEGRAAAQLPVFYLLFGCLSFKYWHDEASMTRDEPEVCAQHPNIQKPPAQKGNMSWTAAQFLTAMMSLAESIPLQVKKMATSQHKSWAGFAQQPLATPARTLQH
jgi:hypothetical protein